MTSTFAVLVFLILFALVLVVVSFGFRILETEKRRKLTGMLEPGSNLPPVEEVDILSAEEIKGLIDFKSLAIYRHVQETIDQAGLEWTPGQVLAATAGLGFVGLLLGLRVHADLFREFTMAGLAILLGGLPYMFLSWKRRQRLNAFEELFPESLDFLARSMRAGHAFSISLEMMADESPEPAGYEFRRVAHEHNLGSPLETCLHNLTVRIPLVDVRFFVAAILLQRETGGNLAEILTKLSYIIRERFRLKGQVSSASAHGRLTAVILSAMPLVTMAALMIIAPDYLETMAKDEDGKWIMIAVAAAQFLGYAWMRKIIHIKV